MVEVTNVSAHGFWILMKERELFLSFKVFPWFRDAPIASILRVKLLSSDHLYWPDLDVDLSVESIECPERFPLVSKVRPNPTSTVHGARRAIFGGPRAVTL